MAGRGGSSGVGALFAVLLGFGMICTIGAWVTETWERGDRGPAVKVALFVLGSAAVAWAVYWHRTWGFRRPRRFRKKTPS
jgi:hypothetical protein